MSVTPMMQQYLDVKAKHKDCIVFFRLGDFYEMFFEDAQLVSRELELTLTGKLDNRHGQLLSNGHGLRLAAQEIDNTDAAIIHSGAGTFAITAERITATRGELASSGRLALDVRHAVLDSASTMADTLRIDALELSNRDGRIT